MPPQVVRVVRQLEVAARPLPGGGAPGRILRHHDALLDGEHGLRTEDLAGVPRCEVPAAK